MLQEDMNMTNTFIKPQKSIMSRLIGRLFRWLLRKVVHLIITMALIAAIVWILIPSLLQNYMGDSVHFSGKSFDISGFTVIIPLPENSEAVQAPSTTTAASSNNA